MYLWASFHSTSFLVLMSGFGCNCCKKINIYRESNKSDGIKESLFYFAKVAIFVNQRYKLNKFM